MEVQSGSLALICTRAPGSLDPKKLTPVNVMGPYYAVGAEVDTV